MLNRLWEPSLKRATGLALRLSAAAVSIADLAEVTGAPSGQCRR